MVAFNHQRVVFRHMIELSNCECVFCSAEEVVSGKTRLYLIFKDLGKIYTRNGLNETWDQIEEESELMHIKEGFIQAVTERKIPCFLTSLNTAGV